MPRFFADTDLVKFAKAGSTDAAALARARRRAGDRAVDGGAARGGRRSRSPGRCGCRVAEVDAVDERRRVWRALAPYLLTLAIALPFVVYYFVDAARRPTSTGATRGALLLLAGGAARRLGRLLPRAPARRHHGLFAHARSAGARRRARSAISCTCRAPACSSRIGARRGGAGAAAAAVDRSGRGRGHRHRHRARRVELDARDRLVPDRIERRQARHRALHRAQLVAIASASSSSARRRSRSAR